jgi:hypothetical protein
MGEAKPYTTDEVASGLPLKSQDRWIATLTVAVEMVKSRDAEIERLREVVRTADAMASLLAEVEGAMVYGQIGKSFSIADAIAAYRAARHDSKGLGGAAPCGHPQPYCEECKLVEMGLACPCGKDPDSCAIHADVAAPTEETP